MKYGPIINGYSRSVIIHLIETLRASAAGESRLMPQTGLAAAAFLIKEKPLVRMLENWMNAEPTKVFKTMFDVYNFLAGAERLLHILTPKNGTQGKAPDIVEL